MAPISRVAKYRERGAYKMMGTMAATTPQLRRRLSGLNSVVPGNRGLRLNQFLTVCHYHLDPGCGPVANAESHAERFGDLLDSITSRQTVAYGRVALGDGPQMSETHPAGASAFQARYDATAEIEVKLDAIKRSHDWHGHSRMRRLSPALPTSGYAP